MQAITAPPQFVRSLLEGAKLRGYDAGEILIAEGLPAQIQDNPRFRISTKQFAALTTRIIQMLDDEACGQLERRTPPGLLYFQLRACLSSHSIEDALSLWTLGVNLIDPSRSASFYSGAETGTLALELQKSDSKHNYIAESTLSTVHRILCWLAEDFVPLERVELKRPQSDFSEECHYLFYGVPVLFGQDRDALVFSRRSLDFPCNRTRESLDLFMQAPWEWIVTLSRRGTSPAIKVRLWLEQVLTRDHEVPTLNNAAAHMGLHPQSLKRRLKKEGITYQMLKEETRRDMAINLIGQKRYSVEVIGFMLGYSDASTFIRAFKTWTGLTPLAYGKMGNSPPQRKTKYQIDG